MFGIFRGLSGAASSVRRRASTGSDSESSPTGLRCGASRLISMAGAILPFRKTSRKGKYTSPESVPPQLRPGPPNFERATQSKSIISVVEGVAELPGDVPELPPILAALTSSASLPAPCQDEWSLQLPAPVSTMSVSREEEEVLVEETSFLRKSGLHMKRVTAIVSRRSNDSSWSPAESRPQGFNQIDHYLGKTVSKSVPTPRSGESPEPALPSTRLVLSKRRYSWSTRSSHTTSPSLAPTEVIRRPSFDLSGPIPALELAHDAAKPTFELNSTVTFDSILAEQRVSSQSTKPARRPRSELANSRAPKQYTSQQAQQKTTLLKSSQRPHGEVYPSHVPSLLRPHKPYFLNEPTDKPYEAFKPDIHVVDVASTVQKARDNHYGSIVQTNMANEMHFEHTIHERSHRLSFFERVAPRPPPIDHLCSRNVLSSLPDLTLEMTQIADQIIGKSTTSHDANKHSRPSTVGADTKPKRKPVPVRSPPQVPASFLMPPSPVSPPPVTFSPQKFPLLDHAARSMDTGVLGLKGPLPPGHNSLNGSEPMIARARPIECRGRDGWLHREVDAATEWFEKDKGERLGRRKKEWQEWGYQKGNEEDSIGTDAEQAGLLSWIDFADERKVSPPTGGEVGGDLLFDF